MTTRADGKPFAAGTKVSVERTMGEIRNMSLRAGASEWVTGERSGFAFLQFRLKDRQVRFTLDLSDDPREDRRRWRALAQVIKGKFLNWQEAIETFDEAFLPNIVTSSGQTVAEVLHPALQDGMVDAEAVPALLPQPRGPLQLTARIDR